MAEDSFFAKFRDLDLVYAVLVVVVFLLGIVPAGWYYSQSANDLEVTQKQLRQAEIYGSLATSIIETKDGEYTSAHREASDFFDKLEIEKAKGEEGFISADGIQNIQFILDSKDETLSAIRLEDENSVEKLKAVRAAFVRSVGNKEHPYTIK